MRHFAIVTGFRFRLPPVNHTDDRALAQQSAQLCCDFVPRQRTRSHCEGEVFPSIRIKRLVRQQLVLTQKHEAGCQSDAFVAIDKRMIAAEVEEIGGSNLDEIGNHRNSHQGRLRSGDGGFQQLTRAQTGTPPVRGKHFRVDGKNGLDRWMFDHRTHDSLRKSSLFFWISLRAVSLAVSASITEGCIGAMVIVPPAWTSTFTSSPTFNLASWSSAESKIMPCELPIFEMILITCKTMYYQPRCVNFSHKNATILPCASYDRRRSSFLCSIRLSLRRKSLRNSAAWP